jgi:hypothetical protein
VAASAPTVLADSVGPGGTAALVVFILIIACVGLFVAFLGSQKRLRQNVDKGIFKTHDPRAAKDAAAQASAPKTTVTPDPGDQPGEGV